MKNLKLAIKKLKLRRKFKRYRLIYDESFTSFQYVKSLIDQNQLDENKLKLRYKVAEDECSEIGCTLVGGMCECTATESLNLNSI